MPGIVMLSIAVELARSSQLRLPFTPSVIAAVAVEMRNVPFPVTGATVNGPRVPTVGLESTNILKSVSVYLHRTIGVEAVHVKVTSVPLQTSVPASLDSSTAAETERNSKKNYYTPMSTCDYLLASHPLMWSDNSHMASHCARNTYPTWHYVWSD